MAVIYFTTSLPQYKWHQCVSFVSSYCSCTALYYAAVAETEWINPYSNVVFCSLFVCKYVLIHVADNHLIGNITGIFCDGESINRELFPNLVELESDCLDPISPEVACACCTVCRPNATFGSDKFGN